VANDNNRELILEPTGRICLGEGLADFQEMLADAVSQPAAQVTLRLGAVTYIDSSGIGEILKLFLELKSHGHTLVLADVPPPILKIFRSTKLDRVFTIR
jgi:anti-sigma B factor antagonist